VNLKTAIPTTSVPTTVAMCKKGKRGGDDDSDDDLPAILLVYQLLKFFYIQKGTVAFRRIDVLIYYGFIIVAILLS
jgi:hypothetical protein